MVYDADLPADTFAGVSALFSGTAPLDPELGRQFEERYGIPVLVVYGATEFAGGVAGWTLADWRRFGEAKAGSVGRPNAGVRVRIVDQTGEEMARNEVGLLEVQARNSARPAGCEPPTSPAWTKTTSSGSSVVPTTIIASLAQGGHQPVRDVIAAHPAVLDVCVISVSRPAVGSGAGGGLSSSRPDA